MALRRPGQVPSVYEDSQGITLPEQTRRKQGAGSRTKQAHRSTQVQEDTADTETDTDTEGLPTTSAAWRSFKGSQGVAPRALGGWARMGGAQRKRLGRRQPATKQRHQTRRREKDNNSVMCSKKDKRLNTGTQSRDNDNADN